MCGGAAAEVDLWLTVTDSLRRSEGQLGSKWWFWWAGKAADGAGGGDSARVLPPVALYTDGAQEVDSHAGRGGGAVVIAWETPRPFTRRGGMRSWRSAWNWKSPRCLGWAEGRAKVMQGVAGTVFPLQLIFN